MVRAQVKHLLRAVVPRHVLWGAQSGAVFDALRGDFMTDVVSVVDELLAEGAHATPLRLSSTDRSTHRVINLHADVLLRGQCVHAQQVVFLARLYS